MGPLKRAHSELTEREAQVAVLLVEGLQNKEIACRLSITEGAVKQYLYHAMKKLRFQNRTQVAVWAASKIAHDIGAHRYTCI